MGLLKERVITYMSDFDSYYSKIREQVKKENLNLSEEGVNEITLSILNDLM